MLLKRRENPTSDERGRLRRLLTLNLRSVRACLLAEAFQRFWKYRSSLYAERFLARWTTTAMRSRLGHEKPTAFETTNTPKSPCITHSAIYPSPIGSPTDSAEEALSYACDNRSSP